MSSFLDDDDLNDLTPEVVRRWGYDVNLFLMSQDEELLLYDVRFLPVLLELIADNDCPKRECAASTLDQFSTSVLLRKQRSSADEFAAIARETKFELTPEIARWKEWFLELHERLVSPRPVSDQESERIAWRLSTGDFCRRDFSCTGRIHEGHSEYLSSTSSYRLYLYVQKETGTWEFRLYDPWGSKFDSTQPTQFQEDRSSSQLGVRWILGTQILLTAVAIVASSAATQLLPSSLLPPQAVLTLCGISTIVCPLFVVIWSSGMRFLERVAVFIASVTISIVTMYAMLPLVQ